MARHVWSVLCERILVDKDSGGLSLIETTEALTLSGPEQRPGAGRPQVVVPVELALVSLWSQEDEAASEEGRTRVRVLGPEGQTLVEGRDIDVDLKSRRRVHTVGRIHALPVTGAGTYELVVDYRRAGEDAWAERARLPLEVTVRPEA